MYGDLDVVLTDCALNKLLENNGDSTYVEGRSYIETAKYNTLAEYFFGNAEMAVSQYEGNKDGETYQERLENFWELYQNGTVKNLTAAFQCEDNFELGIISNHAYAIKDYVSGTNGYISLVNVWDNKDVLNLYLDTFYSIEGNVFVYGYKYNNEEWNIDNIDATRGFGSDVCATPVYTDVIAQQTQSWITANSGVIDAVGFVDNSNTISTTELIAGNFDTETFKTDLSGNTYL